MIDQGGGGGRRTYKLMRNALFQLQCDLCVYSARCKILRLCTRTSSRSHFFKWLLFRPACTSFNAAVSALFGCCAACACVCVRETTKGRRRERNKLRCTSWSKLEVYYYFRILKHTLRFVPFVALELSTHVQSTKGTRRILGLSITSMLVCLAYERAF